MTDQEILQIRYYCSDLDQEMTIHEYLVELLRTLWVEGETFSGKGPFGNSGWQEELLVPLARNGLIKGRIDPDDGWYTGSEKERAKGFKIITRLIESLRIPNES